MTTESPPEMLTFFRGPNIFFTSFFVQNWKSWFYGKKANNSAIQPQKFKNPGSFTNLIKAILLQQVISSFHMSSFNTWPTSAWVSLQVCPSTASCPLWPTQRPSIISPCVASSFCCPSSWASWFCIQNSRKLSKNEWEIRGWGWGWVFCVESKRIQQQNPNWERVNWFEVTMERNVLKVFGIRLLPIKNLSTKLWLHTILWFFLHFGRNQVMSLWWWSLTGVVREMVSTWLIRERQPVHFFVHTRDVRTYSWLCQDMICWHIETQARIYRCWFICTCTCYMYDKCVYTHTWLNICWTYYEYINVHVHISYLIYPYRTEHVFMSSKTLGAPLHSFFQSYGVKIDRMNILKFLLGPIDPGCVRWFGFGGEAAAEVASWRAKPLGIRAVGSVYDYLQNNR